MSEASVHYDECPPIETLAAFVDGVLSDEEAQSVVDHLSSCDRCEAIVSRTMRAVDALESGQPRRASRLRKAAPAVAAVVALIATGIAVWWEHAPMRSLTNAARSLPHRPIEARVAGFPWSPFDRPRSDGQSARDAATLEFDGVAGKILSRTSDASSTASRHANGVAALMIGDERRAVKELEPLTQRNPTDAVLWNDLAAARLAIVSRDNDVQEAALALADADRALDLAPEMREALFNRALALDALGLMKHAAEAWHRYLAVDGTSPWSQDARHHLDAGSYTPKSQWKTAVKPVLERAASSGDLAKVLEIVRSDPQNARGWGEWYYLGQWGDATLKGDKSAAAQSLNVATLLGDGLLRVNGEGLLHDAAGVAARAQGDHVQELAHAHEEYYDARSRYAARLVDQAFPMFTDAERLFAAAGSPMQLTARYYVAQCLADTTKSEESLSILRALDMKETYKGLRAQVTWEIATVVGRIGHLSDSVTLYSRADAAFVNLGETENANLMRSMWVSVLSTMGKSRDAWQVRRAIFRTMSEAGDAANLENAINTAARTEAIRGQWDSAASLYALIVNRTEPPHNPRIFADASLWQALALESAGREDEGMTAIASARMAARNIADASLRNGALRAFRLAEGILLRDRDPDRSASLLALYVADARQRDDLYLLPEALLERGRALRKLARGDEARTVLNEAIGMIEARRSAIASDDLRDAYFGGAASVLREMIDLLDERRDRAGVFNLAEKAYGRVILDRVGGAAAQPLTLPDAQRQLPERIRVIQYVVLPKRVVVQTMTAASCDSRSIDIDRQELQADVDGLLLAIQERHEAGARTMSRRLYDVLLAPIADQIGEGDTLVVVPDGPIRGIPFGALNDGSHFVVEKHVVIHAPSVSVFLHSRARIAGNHPRGTVLAVGNPAFDAARFPTLSPLPDSAREVEDVARIYPGARALTGSDATRSSVMHFLQGSDIVDIACHTVEDGAPRTIKLALAPSTGDDGLLSTPDLASLSMTAHVVVLAGCRTADAADSTRSIDSISTAFLLAGAANTVGALVRVDDSTTRYFSREFHQRIQHGEAPADAMRATQLEMLRSSDGSLSGLHAWAAFVLFGAGR